MPKYNNLLLYWQDPIALESFLIRDKLTSHSNLTTTPKKLTRNWSRQGLITVLHRQINELNIKPHTIYPVTRISWRRKKQQKTRSLHRLGLLSIQGHKNKTNSQRYSCPYSPCKVYARRKDNKKNGDCRNERKLTFQSPFKFNCAALT